MNNKIILYNIQEAREQLEEIEKLLNDENLSEVDFQIKLEHAYHHLNFAWNIRRAKTEKYQKLSNKNFNKWSKFPKEIKPFKI
ncbi:MAG TPA: hypothetical protein PKY82_30575 [Pyrinomonadaceae bacterium]|nr:hypothetical protein [Pyrinomonadaceae bacterium]